MTNRGGRRVSVAHGRGRCSDHSSGCPKGATAVEIAMAAEAPRGPAGVHMGGMSLDDAALGLRGKRAARVPAASGRRRPPPPLRADVAGCGPGAPPPLARAPVAGSVELGRRGRATRALALEHCPCRLQASGVIEGHAPAGMVDGDDLHSAVIRLARDRTGARNFRDWPRSDRAVAPGSCSADHRGDVTPAVSIPVGGCGPPKDRVAPRSSSSRCTGFSASGDLGRRADVPVGGSLSRA